MSITNLSTTLVVTLAAGIWASSVAADPNEAQVRRDVQASGAWQNAPLAVYIVPAMSAERRMPERIPEDGKIGDTLTFIAAGDSYEPASFVIYPFQDISRMQIEATDLRSGDAVLPAANVDVKIVKHWFKGGTAWHSYFTDPNLRTLVPELLLNDDSLIQVDLEQEENYLRIDYPEGPVYRWVSYPLELRGSIDVFNHAVEPVRDADTLQPFDLRRGQARQMWVTVHVPEDTKPGLYRGALKLTSGDYRGEIDMVLRVLPFVLPEPKTYYDFENDFYSIIYNTTNPEFYREFLDTDLEAIEAQVLAELINLREHNVKTPLTRVFDNPEMGRRHLRLMREAGMELDTLVNRSQLINWQDIYQYGNLGQDIPAARLEHLAEQAAFEQQFFLDELGHTNVYAIGWDEPGRLTLRSQGPLIDILHNHGFNYYTTAKNWHFEVMGFNQDAVNLSGLVERSSARMWHALDTKVFAYAYPHTGPENPDFIRRTHGMILYKRDYDGSANYRYYGYRQNPWNDFTSTSFRIRFVYPTSDGVVDTLHWAGFREAIDDVRYATKLREVAYQAIAAGDVRNRYLGRKALRYLELMDEASADLNTVRLEMIHQILEIQNSLQGG